MKIDNDFAGKAQNNPRVACIISRIRKDGEYFDSAEFQQFYQINLWIRRERG